MARSHYENFPVASRFVPARLRPFRSGRFYAFARLGPTDFADESRYAGPPPRRGARLLGGAAAPLLPNGEGRAYRCSWRCAETIDQCNIPIQPLEAMLTGLHHGTLTVNRYSHLRGSC